MYVQTQREFLQSSGALSPAICCFSLTVLFRRSFQVRPCYSLLFNRSTAFHHTVISIIYLSTPLLVIIKPHKALLNFIVKILLQEILLKKYFQGIIKKYLMRYNYSKTQLPELSLQCANSLSQEVMHTS